MKLSKKLSFIAIVLSIVSGLAVAENELRFGSKTGVGGVPFTTPLLVSGLVGDAITGERSDAWPSWTNEGSLINCGQFGPDVSTVTSGQSFTQSADCQQNQTRTRSVFSVYSSGREDILREESESQTIVAQDTRAAVGTASFIVNRITENGPSTQTGTSCTGYSPSTYSIDVGTFITQNRTCTYNYSRDVYTYDVYNTGDRVLVGTTTQTFTGTSYNQSRQAEGRRAETSRSTSTWIARNCYNAGSVDKVDLYDRTRIFYSDNTNSYAPDSNFRTLSFALDTDGGSTPCEWYVFIEL